MVITAGHGSNIRHETDQKFSKKKSNRSLVFFASQISFIPIMTKNEKKCP